MAIFSCLLQNTARQQSNLEPRTSTALISDLCAMPYIGHPRIKKYLDTSHSWRDTLHSHVKNSCNTGVLCAYVIFDHVSDHHQSLPATEVLCALSRGAYHKAGIHLNLRLLILEDAALTRIAFIKAFINCAIPA